MPLLYEIAELSLRFLHHSHLSRGEASEPAVSLADLESFIGQFPSAGHFLADQAATDRYYSLLRAYFSKSHFSRDSYEHLLDQLRDLAARFPELAERLWRRPGPNISEFSLLKPSRGRRLNQSLWRIFRSRWLRELQQKQNGLTSLDATERAAALVRRIQAFHDDTEGLPRSKRLEAQGTFFRSLKDDQSLGQLAAYFVHEKLVIPRRNLLLTICEADLALDFFKELRDEVAPTLQKEFPNGVPDFLAWKMKSLVPDPAELLRDEALFSRILNRNLRGRATIAGAAQNTQYLTAEVRAIHGIFSGISYHDCLAGSESKLDQCTPRRWAIGALSGSRTFFFMRNGSYQGTIRLVRVRSPGGRPFYSIGMCVPVFNSRARENGLSRSLFETWYPVFARSIRASGIPVVVSESQLADLSQVKPTVWASDLYALAIPVGHSRAFRIADARADEYLEALAPGPAALNYGPSFITDALFVDSGELRALPELEPGALGAFEAHS